MSLYINYSLPGGGKTQFLLFDLGNVRVIKQQVDGKLKETARSMKSLDELHEEYKQDSRYYSSGKITSPLE